MRKLISFIIIALLLFIFTPGIINASKEPKHGCVIELANAAYKIYTLRIKWIDHPFLKQTRGKPWCTITAEIAPKEIFIGTYKHAPGLYTATCQERWKPNTIEISENFTIKAKTKTVIIIIASHKPVMLLIFDFDH